MTELVHYGVKGQRWGVIRKKDSSSASTGKKSTAKPKFAPVKKSPQRIAAEQREALTKEVEFLRSIGNTAAAEKLEKAMADAQTAVGTASGETVEDKEAQTEEGKEGTEGKEDEEEKKEEEGKGKGKGKGAAAPKPKPAKLKEDKEAKAEKEKAAKEKAERSKWQALAKSQREIASTFRDGAIAAKQEINKLAASSSSLSKRLPGFRKDLEIAQANGDDASIKTIQNLISRIQGEIKANASAIAVQQDVGAKLLAKSNEWEATAQATLEKIKSYDEDDKTVKQSGMQKDKFISHYGVKGQRWGIRRTKSQLAKAAGRSPRVAQRQASKEAKGLSDAELKAKINRLSLEKQYSDLVKQQVERDRTALEEGASEVGKVLQNIGKQSITNVGSKTLTYGLIKGVQAVGVPIKEKK